MLMMCHVVLGLTFRRKGIPSLVIEILTIGAGRVNGSINIFLILKVVKKKDGIAKLFSQQYSFVYVLNSWH